MNDDYVVIVPFDPFTGKYLVQHQYKSGAKRYCWGFPAGFIEKGESPIAAAERELLEETGLKANYMKPIGEFYDNTSLGSKKFYIFSTLIKSQNNKQNSNPDKNEGNIQFLFLSPEFLPKMEGACMELAKKLLT